LQLIVRLEAIKIDLKRLKQFTVVAHLDEFDGHLRSNREQGHSRRLKGRRDEAYSLSDFLPKKISRIDFERLRSLSLSFWRLGEAGATLEEEWERDTAESGVLVDMTNRSRPSEEARGLDFMLERRLAMLSRRTTALKESEGLLSVCSTMGGRGADEPSEEDEVAKELCVPLRDKTDDDSGDGGDSFSFSLPRVCCELLRP